MLRLLYDEKSIKSVGGGDGYPITIAKLRSNMEGDHNSYKVKNRWNETFLWYVFKSKT